ncbi:hypothetical protein VTH06DRAFT_2136 [Thermothelomyces fergusii]
MFITLQASNGRDASDTAAGLCCLPNQEAPMHRQLPQLRSVSLQADRKQDEPVLRTPQSLSVDLLDGPLLFNLDAVEGLAGINMATQEPMTMLGPDPALPSLGQLGVPSGVSPAPDTSQNSTPSCSCLSDLVRVVQQLDDDEFRITTLSLDQVLHLQKWLIFQCCKPLDCADCLDPPAVHTVRLIVCDRLTEMFECIHSRIKRAGAVLASQQVSDPGRHSTSTSSSLPSSSTSSSFSSCSSSSSSQSPGSPRSVPQPQPPPWSSAAVGPGPLPAQLFCGSSGRAASTVACNPLMFSDDFRSRYSDEEQVHMIGALLRLQVRDFRKLLLRLEGETAREGVHSQARRSRIQSMTARLAKAAADIEDALRLVSRVWSTG